MLLLQEICAYYVCKWCVAVVPLVYSRVQCTTDGVINPLIPHRYSFDGQLSAGHTTARDMFAWTRVITEAIVKPKRTSSLGH